MILGEEIMRNKNNLVIVMIGLVLISSIFLSGCVSETENKIIVGTSADYPPFEYVENGEIVGFDIELITTLLENLNYTVEVQDVGWESLIPSLNSGSIDVIAAAMTITPEREDQIDFSDPYYNSDQSILALANANITIEADEDLANLTIGAQTGTTGELWVIENLINISNATMTDDQLKRYDTYTLAVLDLNNEKIDAVILDKPVAESFAKDESRSVVYVLETDENFGFGVVTGNDDLLSGINSELTTFMESEDWTTLLNKYFE
jgi:polar amino acid transport system substrate-binding protein